MRNIRLIRGQHCVTIGLTTARDASVTYGTSLSSAVLLPIHLPAHRPGKAAENGVSTWTCETHRED